MFNGFQLMQILFIPAQGQLSVGVRRSPWNMLCDRWEMSGV